LPRSRTEVNQAAISATLASCKRLSPLSSDAEALTHVRDALNMLPMEIVAMAIGNGWDPATGNETAGDEYDDYFGVVRVSGDPLRRWRVGHHVFFALIQSLVVTFHWFSSAIAAADLDAAQAALELAATLMWGSAAAFRFAGDFPPEEYDEVVRPSMMPPNLAP